ncbi:hypothetical protein XNC3_1060016 [Xenorhabdus nematophila F1]|nr:hypothetical protein XNC3_1060016 [Xenorhabdus nematophila F1]
MMKIGSVVLLKYPYQKEWLAIVDSEVLILVFFSHFHYKTILNKRQAVWE